MASVDAFDTLRLPVVRAFALARLMSSTGQTMLTTAVGWHLYEQTNSAWALGLVGLVILAPVLLFMVVAGNVADRYPRRNVAVLAQVILVCVAAGLAVMTNLGASAESILAVLFLYGTARAFIMPSYGTILPQLIKPEQFANANAWIVSVVHVAFTAGPAVGGYIIAATGGAQAAYTVCAVLQVLAIIALLRLPAIPPPPSDPESRRTAAQVFAGFSFIRRNPVYFAAIMLDLFAVLLGGAIALLPIYAKDILHVGPEGLGWLRAAPSLGTVVMTVMITHLKPWQRPGLMLLYAVIGFGLATIVFGFSENFALSFAALFVAGFCDAVSVFVRVTLEQAITPDRLRGRVSAINYVFIGFSNEFGMFESGAVAALFGPVFSVVSGGVGTLIVVAIVARIWPQLARIGPLHMLRPVEDENLNP